MKLLKLPLKKSLILSVLYHVILLLLPVVLACIYYIINIYMQFGVIELPISVIIFTFIFSLFPFLIIYAMIKHAGKWIFVITFIMPILILITRNLAIGKDDGIGMLLGFTIIVYIFTFIHSLGMGIYVKYLKKFWYNKQETAKESEDVNKDLNRK